MTRARVLLAEDHPRLADALKELIQRGFDVVGVVADGQALIEAAKTCAPDIVVSDDSLPQIDGLRALEQIRKHKPGAKMILLTMYREAAVARVALNAGVSGVVLKNSACPDLTSAIHAVLDGRAYVSAALEASASDLARRDANGLKHSDRLP